MNDARHAYDAWHAGLAVDAEADTPWQRLVQAHLAPSLTGRVLEIGCGRGGFSAWLAGHHPDATIVATDFSSVAVRMGAAHARGGARNLRFSVGDIQRLAHPDACFDTVVSCETVEHVPDAPGAVRELARVLKPGGTLLLTTPNYFGPVALYRGYLRIIGRPYTEVGQPINTFTFLPRTLRWVRRAGLRVRSVDGTGHYLPRPGKPWLLLPGLDEPRVLTRWFALHSLVVATKPA